MTEDRIAQICKTFLGGAGSERLPMNRVLITRRVACGDCHLCCLGDTILLHPEMGDMEGDYEIEKSPFGPMLAHKSNMECYALGENGCTIYDKRPGICKEFDCADLIRRTTRPERKRMVKAGAIDKRVLKQGAKLFRQQEHGVK